MKFNGTGNKSWALNAEEEVRKLFAGCIKLYEQQRTNELSIRKIRCSIQEKKLF